MSDSGKGESLHSTVLSWLKELWRLAFIGGLLLVALAAVAGIEAGPVKLPAMDIFGRALAGAIGVTLLMVGLVLGARRPEIDLGVRPDAKTYYGIRIESPKVSSTEVEPVVTGRLSKRVPVGQELRIITTSPNRDRYWVQEPVVVDPEKPAWHGTAGISKTSGNHTWILATVVGPTSLAWWSHCRRVTQLTGQWEPIEGKLPPDIVVCDEVLIERK